jgi:hypothetical protein
MKRIHLTFVFCLVMVLEASAQNIPSNFTILNDYLRREQVLGNTSSNFSFSYRPVLVEKAFPEYSSPFLNDSIPGYATKLADFQKNKLKITALPVHLITVFNSSNPYGWGNGPLIPTKGVQTLWSAGVHVKYGKLSIQLYPQFQYAQNKAFEEYPANAPDDYFRLLSRSVNVIDHPVRPSGSSVSQIFLGNSHLNLNLGGITVGLSSENLWLGPGQFNALILSDNAPGFHHFKVHSSRPLKTFLGGIEGMYWIGRLVGSGRSYFSDGKASNLLRLKENNDWMYFTGLSLSYSPKWTPGFSVGINRVFQIYRDDMGNDLRSYFPLFAPFPKKGEGLVENLNKKENQNVSVFGRWVIPEAKWEFYFEYARNDHSLDWRDLILNPEHSRGFLLGFSKYFRHQTQQSWGVIGEITHTQFSLNNIIRWGEGLTNRGLGLYDNAQVIHGLTNKGQTLGASTGISGNAYTLKAGKFAKLQEFSIQLERLERHPNFYKYAQSAGMNVRPWIDHAVYANYSDNLKNLLLKTSAGVIHSSNYNYLVPTMGSFEGTANQRLSFNVNLSVIYLL